jgi:hypothetical protein
MQRPAPSAKKTDIDFRRLLVLADEEEPESLREGLRWASHVPEGLLGDARYFLETARRLEREDTEKRVTYVRASVIAGFAALEAWVNGLSFVLAEYDNELELHERAFLQEQRVELDNAGYFVIRGGRYRGLEEKIRFFHWRLKGTEIGSKDPTWIAFDFAKRLRNKIVHPKPGMTTCEEPSMAAAESALKAVTDVIHTFLRA